MRKKTWEEVEHKFHPLWLTGLSSTDYDGRFNKKYQALARLKTHFSLLDDENDEVDSEKVKYYNIWPNKADIFLGIPAIAILVYLFIKT